MISGFLPMISEFTILKQGGFIYVSKDKESYGVIIYDDVV